MSGDKQFREKHASVLAPVRAVMNSDQATLDRHALQQNYLQHLVSLGLLARPLEIDLKTGYPVLDKFTKDWKTRGHQVTPLGRLLLRHIGLSLEPIASE